MAEKPQTQVSQNGNDIKVEVEVDEGAQGGKGTQDSAASGFAGASHGPSANASSAGSSSGAGQNQAPNYRKSGEAAGKAFRDAKHNATEVFEGIAPGHGNEIFFGLVGLVAAILIFWIGFWQALVVVLLIIVGVAFGQWVDGKPTIINGIKRLFSSNDN